MTRSSGSTERRRLPVIVVPDAPEGARSEVDLGGAAYLNPRCVLVNRLGEQVYRGCRSCTLRLGECLQFGGQLASTAIMVILLVLAVAPMSFVGRAVCVIIAGVVLLVHLRRVGRESHRGIMQSHELGQQRDRLGATTRALEEANAELSRSLSRLDEARREARQSSRMATMGAVTAGVAHEINNPLALTLVNLDFLAGEIPEILEHRRSTRPPPCDLGAQVLTPGFVTRRLREMAAALEDARDGAHRVQSIVRTLKTMSRDDDRSVPVDVSAVIESSVKIAAVETKQRARVVLELGDVPKVLGSESRLVQVVVNLLVNAAQAIPEGSVERNEIRVVTRCDDLGSVVIDVRDTGIGIPEEVRGLLFEPFFTTKEVDVGTGLGLFICRDLVAAIGGEITVESEVGKGSTFHVALPAATATSTIDG